jgi:hypothetical protein
MEAAMNGSFYDIDWDVHLKVVFVALCAGIAVVSIALALH